MPSSDSMQARTDSPESDRTLANEHQGSHPSATTDSPKSHPKPEVARNFTTPRQFMDDAEAEREFAEFGGDAPMPLGAVQLKTRRMSTSAPGGRQFGQRSRSRSESLPPLYLVDSAFSESHRVMSRLSRQERENQGHEPSPTPTPDHNKVDWKENDPENPQNWSNRKKWLITALCGALTIVVTFASSAPSTATREVAAEFGCSEEVAILTTSLFLCGYCVGPVLWAPVSEMVGRRPVFIATLLVFALLQIGDALANNIEALVIIRFFAGTFAASPLTNCGGVIADMFDAIGRGPAMSVFSAAVFLGPTIAPSAAGFLTTSSWGWRAIYWVIGVWALVSWAVVVVALPETYHPILLTHRAKRMRKENPEKNGQVYAELEKADFSLKSIMSRTLLRPFKMLAVEPILMLVTLYLSVVYGILYATFSVFPIIWQHLRGFTPGTGGLIFFGVGIGTTLGALLNIRLQRHYRELVPRWHGHPPPEERLWGSMAGGPFLVIGLLWLGWSGNYASVHWIVPTLATVALGMSFTLIFISFLSYLIEVYLMYSASALAANTILRSAVGAAFPLFTTQMFNRLGVNWACTLIAGISLLIAPSPFIFFKYGARIRGGSQFAPCLDLQMKEQVEREHKEEKEKKQGTAV